MWTASLGGLNRTVCKLENNVPWWTNCTVFGICVFDVFVYSMIVTNCVCFINFFFFFSPQKNSNKDWHINFDSQYILTSL